jgi:hypothetical protein
MEMSESVGPPTVLLLPRHNRDQKRMLAVVEGLAHLKGLRVQVLKTLPKSSWEIFFWQGLRRFRLVPVGGETGIVYSPRLTYGRMVDPGMARATERLARRFQGPSQNIVAIVVGDSHQETTPFVNLLQQLVQCEVILSPEGIGVFRSIYGSYEWEVSSRYSASSALFADLFSSQKSIAAKRNGISRQHPFSGLWKVERLSFVLRSRAQVSNADFLRLKRVDLLVTEWPQEVDLGIVPRRIFSFVPSPSPSSSSSTDRAKPQLPFKPHVALFVHQPLTLSFDTWRALLQPFEERSFSEFIIKARDDRRGLDNLSQAVLSVFPDSKVREITSGSAEEIIWSERPLTVIGVTSTVLLNIALSAHRPEVFSLGLLLKKVGKAGEEQTIADNTGHQLLALQKIVGQQVVFL